MKAEEEDEVVDGDALMRLGLEDVQEEIEYLCQVIQGEGKNWEDDRGGLFCGSRPNLRLQGPTMYHPGGRSESNQSSQYEGHETAYDP